MLLLDEDDGDEDGDDMTLAPLLDEDDDGDEDGDDMTLAPLLDDELPFDGDDTCAFIWSER